MNFVNMTSKSKGLNLCVSVMTVFCNVGVKLRCEQERNANYLLKIAPTVFKKQDVLSFCQAVPLSIFSRDFIVSRALYRFFVTVSKQLFYSQNVRECFSMFEWLKICELRSNIYTSESDILKRFLERLKNFDSFVQSQSILWDEWLNKENFCSIYEEICKISDSVFVGFIYSLILIIVIGRQSQHACNSVFFTVILNVIAFSVFIGCYLCVVVIVNYIIVVSNQNWWLM